MANFFKRHDRSTFEIIGFSIRQPFNSEGEQRQQQLRAQVDEFYDLVYLQTEARAREIVNRKIDILVDLVGLVDEADINIFSYKPAPVQISFLGFPGTTGSEKMDYYVGDMISTDPDRFSYFFTEKLLILPHTYQVTEHKEEYGTDWQLNASSFEVPELTQNKYYDENTTFVFCNFNHLHKLDKQTFMTWMDILKTVNNSVLWLLDGAARSRVLRFANATGVDPERIIFSSSIDKVDHMKRLFSRAHLLLDTPIYNAHTSAGDAMYAGVPIVTIEGDLMASRVASSMIKALGNDELHRQLVATNLQDYKDKAIFYATHRNQLKLIREMILGARSTAPLFDTELFVKNLEQGFLQVFRRFQKGQFPALTYVGIED